MDNKVVDMVDELLFEVVDFATNQEGTDQSWKTFCENLANNNLDPEQSKEVKEMVKGKVRQYFRSTRIRYGTMVEGYESMTEKIRQWNLYRNQVNCDLAYCQKVLEDKEVSADVMGVTTKEMAKLLEAITKTKFQHTPKGPIGTCFSVAGNWKPMVEYILRPFLYIFLVDNQADRKLLDELVDRYYGDCFSGLPSDSWKRPAAWVSSFDLAGPPVVESCSISSPTLTTVLDAIHIHAFDPVVTQFLVDYAKLHRILLFKTQHEAFPILSEKNTLPKGCLMAYTMDLFKVTPHPCFNSVQLDEDEMNYDIGVHYSKNSPVSGGLADLTEAKLRIFQSTSKDLERIIHSIKDMQLELLSNLLKTKAALERQERGFKKLKKLSEKTFMERLAAVSIELAN